MSTDFPLSKVRASAALSSLLVSGFLLRRRAGACLMRCAADAAVKEGGRGSVLKEVIMLQIRDGLAPDGLVTVATHHRQGHTPPYGLTENGGDGRCRREAC